MDLWAVLLTGLFAGGVSCAAVQGGLLTGLVSRQRGVSPADPPNKVGISPTKAETEPPVPRYSSLADDVAPVGGFLVGKLASHVVLGAGLGALGGAVALSVGTRTTVQLLAGFLVIAFGLAQLGVPGFRRIVIEPPASWSRFVRGRARSVSMFAPGLLGFATVLIPCGVTLSVMALALASGSVWAGAATMGVFVAGTAPLFAVVGYAARKAATVWRGRLAVATGLLVLGMGLYTVNGALELRGSSLAASQLAQAAGLTPGEPVDSADVVSVVDGRQTVIVTARTGSYSPDNIKAAPGLPTTLVVRSKDARGCVRSFVLPSQDKEWVLPADGDTRIELGVLREGVLRYSCGMGMYTGVLTIG